jgi:hypothetical protein
MEPQMTPAPETAPADAITADAPIENAAPGKTLSPQARRALEEAQARRAAQDAKTKSLTAQREHQGRDGPEPVRYGDWESKGIACDF